MDTTNIIAANKARATHGMWKSREYQIWRQMRDRCNNPNSRRYKNYGGRGITVCKRWDSFERFYEDMGPAPSLLHTIERINNDGKYTPANCRWATPQEQANNRRTNKLITYRGKTQTIAQWARELGLPYHWIKYRLSIGWKPPKLFSPEKMSGTAVKHTVIYNGRRVDLHELSVISGVKYQTLYWRMKNHKPLLGSQPLTS